MLSHLTSSCSLENDSIDDLMIALFLLPPRFIRLMIGGQIAAHILDNVSDGWPFILISCEISQDCKLIA